MLLQKLITIDKQNGSPYVSTGSFRSTSMRNGQLLHERVRQQFGVRVSKGNAVVRAFTVGDSKAAVDHETGVQSRELEQGLPQASGPLQDDLEN